MNRRIKILGLLVAVFAFSGIATASASAAVEYHSEVQPTFLQGFQLTTNVFKTTAGTVKCKGAEFTAEAATKTVNTLSVTPKYTECTAFGQAAEVTMNECKYDFTPINAGSSTVEIKCPTGHDILIDVPGGNCSLTVYPTTPTVDVVDTKNEGVGVTRAVLVTSTVTGIDIEAKGPGTICGVVNKREDDETSYTGTVLLKGFSNSTHTSQVGIWVE